MAGARVDGSARYIFGIFYFRLSVDICAAYFILRGMADETTRIILEIPNDLLAQVTEHRFVRRLPSRTEAFRRLIKLGLEAASTEVRSDAA
jgi:hypothetical protein